MLVVVAADIAAVAVVGMPGVADIAAVAAVATPEAEDIVVAAVATVIVKHLSPELFNLRALFFLSSSRLINQWEYLACRFAPD
jgi:hypothetical protein